MFNFQFNKKYNELYKLASELEYFAKTTTDLSKGDSKAYEVSELLNYLYDNGNYKQRKQVIKIYSTLNQCCLYYDCLKKKLYRLQLGDELFKDTWFDFVETMLTMFSYRVFNNEIIRPAAIKYLTLQKYRSDYLPHQIMLEDILTVIKGGKLEYNFLDNSYDKYNSRALFEFLDEPLKKYLNGEPLLISEDEKEDYQARLMKENYQVYLDCPIYTFNIITDDKKEKIKIGQRPTDYIWNLKETIKRAISQSHKAIIKELIDKPYSISLLAYLISVTNGNTHYTYLNNHIDMILNDNNNNNIYGYKNYIDDKFIKVLCKYFMMATNIIPSSKRKAYEYLNLNIAELIKASDALAVVFTFIPKELQSLITIYHYEVSVNNDFKTIYLSTNPLNLNCKELKVYLDNSSNFVVFKTLNLLKENNHLIYEHIFSEYNEIYNKELELDNIRKQEELEKKQEEEEQRRQQEIEKKKQEEEEQRRQQLREKIKAEIEKKYEPLSEEQLDELMTKTDDRSAMFKLAEYYFNQAHQNKEYYRLAHKYFMIVGKLGDNVGYTNAAISLSNLAKKEKKDSVDYNNLYQEMFHIIEEAPLFYLSYALYTIYSVDKFHYTNMGYIEDNYKVLMSDEKLNDFGKKYVTAAYYFYKKQYDKSISIFNEIRDYVGYSIITIYARTFAVEFHNFFITIKDPHDPNILFINPYKKEHQEYQRRLDQYNSHLQTAASTRSLIDWASNLNEPDISKFKAKCLYYGSLKYEKNPVEAFRLLHKFRNSFTANDQDCIDLYEKLKQELGKTAKDIIKASH